MYVHACYFYDSLFNFLTHTQKGQFSGIHVVLFYNGFSGAQFSFGCHWSSQPRSLVCHISLPCLWVYIVCGTEYRVGECMFYCLVHLKNIAWCNVISFLLLTFGNTHDFTEVYKKLLEGVVYVSSLLIWFNFLQCVWSKRSIIFYYWHAYLCYCCKLYWCYLLQWLVSWRYTVLLKIGFQCF